MRDNELFALVRSAILAGLAARTMPGYDVARKFQPSHQGQNRQPTVYVFKLLDKLHGSPQRKHVWDEVAQVMTAATSQQCETTFQASIDVDETTDPTALTPSDVANVVAAIMHSDETQAALRAAEVGILRVGEVRNPYNKDDSNRYEANPSFDFVLTYRRTEQATAPYAVGIETSVNRV